MILSNRKLSSSLRIAPAFFAAVTLVLVSSCAPYQAKRKPVEPRTTGAASWYGAKFAGRKTASGERYNPKALTAAHKTLPMGTRVKVTNVENGKFVTVRINDRGPFVRGRIIDLSMTAAKTIGMIGAGTARVELAVLSRDTEKEANSEEESSSISKTHKKTSKIETPDQDEQEF